MSAPSSDGRPSLSSELSVTSSHTLHSKTSGSYVDNGGGSGSSRLAPEAIDEHDFARRRHRTGRTGRTGGGFLLDVALPGGPRTRHSRHSRHTPDGKGKSRARRHDDEGDDDDGNGRLRMPKTRSSIQQPAPAADANQLVHMALNLSESRRRNISASTLLGSPRAASGAHRDGSLSHAGGSSSLRQYLNEQRRVSRNISPMGRSSPSRHLSTSHSTLHPSPATIARIHRARAYIELRAEYMRLLDFLPPLKDDANAPGNYNYAGFAVPGSPHAYLTRTPSYANKKHPLGRPYNPLQALRNRRSRARERLALPHEPAAFSDIEHVHDWVDDVEEQSKKPDFRLEDRVALPLVHHDHETQHTPPKPSKAHQGWSFTPEELLADAYWLEHGANKAIIEDRHGRKIFPPREPPKQQKPDFLAPRPSKDSSRRRSWVDGLSGTDPGTGDESEQPSERARKKRLLPKIRANSRLRSGRGSPRKHSLSSSDSSDTDHDVRKVRKSLDFERNTGPLQLQMKRQLELKTQGLDNKTPAVDTPDTPDKWGRGHDVSDGSATRMDETLRVPRLANTSTTRMDETLRMPLRSRTNPLTPIKSAEPRSSFEDDSTAPSTPLHIRHFPHIGSDLSPPPGTDGSDRGKSKRSKLNPFHALHDRDKHEQRHEQRHEQHETDPASVDKQTSRHTSEEPQEPGGFGNAIFAAPGAVKSLLAHRKNESVSSLDSPDKLRRKGTQDLNKEPDSAVTRFFKGVKHEGTKVGDIIFRRDRADDEDASTASDVDFDDEETHRPGLSPTVSSTTAGSVAEEGRSHLRLPSFRPLNEALSDNDDTSDLEHHISRQSRERRNDRSVRIDRLLPPRMDLERVSSASTTATLGPVRSHEDHVKTQLGRPGGVYGFPGTLPPTALKGAPTRKRSASRPTLDGRRHWSIADDDSDDEHALRRKNRQNVSQADIARVRALFLCSGIKAKEISRRALTPRDPAPDFLKLAAETAGKQLFPVPRKEEHVLAARILVTDLERSTSALHRACDDFRTGAIKDLNTKINNLRDNIETHLMPRIFDAGDQAVRITSEVSSQGPLHVKQVNDEIDRLLRQRRRHARWAMSWGWSAVEWSIVVALRLASVVFAIYGLGKSVVVVVWGVVRWLLWL